MIFDLFSCWSSNRKSSKTTETAPTLVSDVELSALKKSLDTQLAENVDPLLDLVAQYHAAASKKAGVDKKVYLALALQFEYAYQQTGRQEFLFGSAVIELTRLRDHPGCLKNGRTKIYMIGHFNFDADLSKMRNFVDQFKHLVDWERARRPTLRANLKTLQQSNSSQEPGYFAMASKSVELQHIKELDYAMDRIKSVATVKKALT